MIHERVFSMNQVLTVIVCAVHRQRYECLTDDQTILYAQLKTSAYARLNNEQLPTVGDRVDLIYNETGDSQIILTHPRKTLLKRLDPSSSGHAAQLIAANVDHVFMLTSANQDFNVNRIYRYQLLTKQSGAKFLVVINKIDLADQATRTRLLSMVSQSLSGEEAVICVSCVTGEGIEQLRSIMHPGSVNVFLGSSGVGKSTLTNELMQRPFMNIGDIREEDAKGRHTTTFRQMLLLPNKAMIIDTPGMRELGLWDAKEEVDASFSDITALLKMCRFRNCTHTHEAGCAVKAAIAKGKLSPQRWQLYRQLSGETRVKRSKEKSPRKAFKKNRSTEEQWDDI